MLQVGLNTSINYSFNYYVPISSQIGFQEPHIGYIIGKHIVRPILDGLLGVCSKIFYTLKNFFNQPEKSEKFSMDQSELAVMEITDSCVTRCFITLNNTEEPTALLVYLHGLEKNKEISESSIKVFVKIARAARSMRILPIFPIGQEGIFRREPTALAWFPDKNQENQDFLNSLLEYYEQRYSINNRFLIGFSNGAFFASKILQSSYSQMFNGYWLSGGGQVEDGEVINFGQKVILEVGRGDTWQYDGVQTLHKQLKKTIDGTNLIFRCFLMGHRFNLRYLSNNLLLLNQNKINNSKLKENL